MVFKKAVFLINKPSKTKHKTTTRKKGQVEFLTRKNEGLGGARAGQEFSHKESGRT
jgi:hypothetical protein